MQSFSDEEKESPAEIYEKAISKLYGKKFAKFIPVEDPDGAIKLFQKIIDEYPDSPLVPYAEIGIAEAYMKKGEIPTAIENFKSFLERYPNHPKVPYAMCKQAEAHISLLSTFDRDLYPAREALDIFNEIKRRYPSSEECDHIDEKIIELRTLMAKRELYVANFYLKRENYQAALMRVGEVLEKYRDLPVYKEAIEMKKKIESRLRLEERKGDFEN